MEILRFEYNLSKDLLHMDFEEELPYTQEVHDKNLVIEKIYSELGDNHLTGLKMHDFLKKKVRYGEDLAELGVDIDLERELIPHLLEPAGKDVIEFTLYKIDGRWQRVY